MRRFAALVAVAVMAVGCGGSAKPAPAPVAAATEPVAVAKPEVAPEPPPPPPVDGEGVALLDAGAEPRAVLRYDLKDKTKRKVDFEMKMGEAGSRKLAWTYDLRREGDGFRLTMKVGKADAPFKGKSSKWLVSARGRHEAPVADNKPQQLLQATQAEHMLPVLPGDAVGVGARWTSAVALSGGLGVATVPGIITWELTGVDGTVVSARGELDVRGEGIPFRDATMDLEAKGSVVVKIDLTSLAGEATLELTMHSQAEGAKAIDYTSTSTMKLR